ncbi:MAG: hypothetical protein JNN00_02830 [Chitinophagaceae bacterium]|nr:hypothetical protein [Chitinophagaceae bacterium]
MDLNQIQLPAAAIADLYRTSLIETNEDITRSEADPVPAVVTNQQKYLGENQKNILVVVNYKDAVYLPDEELTFLTNMLTACKLSLADVAVVNRSTYEEMDHKVAIAGFKSRIIFLFGIDPVSFGLPVDFPHFQVQSFANTTFLYTPKLEECRNDGVLKSKLWVCLRRIFGI